MTSNSKTNNRRNTTDDSILNGILTIVERHTASAWRGTMTDLNTALVRVLGRKNSNMLPGSPGALRIVLNRMANRLRSRGIGVKFGRTSDHTRTRFVRFTR